jgi:hypothetical protein
MIFGRKRIAELEARVASLADDCRRLGAEVRELRIRGEQLERFAAQSSRTGERVDMLCKHLGVLFEHKPARTVLVQLQGPEHSK